MIPNISILGVSVAAISWEELLRAVTAWAEHPETPKTVTYANVHVINLAQKDASLRAILNESDVCYCDGNGVVLGAKLLGQTIPERMTGADWIWDLAAAAEGKWRIFWLGGMPGVTEAAAAKLQEAHPWLQIATDHGFHHTSSDANQACLERINAFEPDIVLVGMGTPIQEEWVATNRASIKAPVVWCIGATADVISGKVKRKGPRWIVKNQEWLSRLMSDPTRLWRRYLVGNTVFLARIAKEKQRPTR